MTSHDHTNEAYRASHEELLSLNEELQSNNEELESAKEELQSLNEEMLAINRRLEAKNSELGVAHTDLQNLVTSSDVPIIFLTRDLRIRRITPAAGRILSLVATDVGRSIEGIDNLVLPPGTGLAAAARSVLTDLTPRTAEVEGSDGEWYLRVVRPYRTETDRIDGVCVSLFNITNQKHAAHLHEAARVSAESLVAESPTALLVLDVDLRVVQANDSFCQTFAALPEDIQGTLIEDLDGNDWVAHELRELLHQVLAGTISATHTEIVRDDDELGRRTTRINIRKMTRGNDRAFVLLNFEDLTSERGAMERVLRQRATELAREHRRKDQFIAMLGHEFRNPLSALKHGLSLLAECGADLSRIGSLRERMDRQTQRMSEMLNQLLDVASLTVAKPEMIKEGVDLAQVISLAVETVVPLIEAKQQSLKVQLPPEASSTHTKGNFTRLAQVVENLLGNASKYTEVNGTIELALTVSEDQLEINVRDEGCGIDAELLPVIFDLFVQGPRTLDRSAGGLGLGLALVRWVVEAHDGTVEAESAGAGQGSTFRVKLPRLAPALATPSPPAVTEHVPVVRGGKGRRILIVDDEADIASGLCELLMARGHVVRAVLSGVEALEALREFNAEVVLLDLGMPEMDGYEVARRLRNIRPESPLHVLALSGYTRDSERLDGAGFDHHMLKPPDMRELLNWLDELNAPKASE